jgi:hypothetical protein
MNTHYNYHRKKTARNAPTHRGQLVKRDKLGNVLETLDVNLRECKATYQDTLFHQYWNKDSGRRRPMTAIFPWTLENVQSFDEMICAEHDKIQSLNDVE